MINWVKYRKYYFVVSFSLLTIGMFFLAKYGLILGLDFVGGRTIEYNISGEVDIKSLETQIHNLGEKQVSIANQEGSDVYVFSFPPGSEQIKGDLGNIVTNIDETADELRFELVGPSFGPELIQKTIYAIIISSGAILVWVALQFKSIKFGASAVVAMLHDSLILLGSFSVFGYFFGVEVDFLFVTALLTTLSFSVHDTIVVYDRIRETQKKEGGDIYQIANRAVSETMVRSLNNSFTIMFMLFALVLLGGESMRWFAVALFIGTVSGTYSSPFVAVPILTAWENVLDRFNERNKS